jgi:hypothetical protein
MVASSRSTRGKTRERNILLTTVNVRSTLHVFNILILIIIIITIVIVIPFFGTFARAIYLRSTSALPWCFVHRRTRLVQSNRTQVNEKRIQLSYNTIMCLCARRTRIVIVISVNGSTRCWSAYFGSQTLDERAKKTKNKIFLISKVVVGLRVNGSDVGKYTIPMIVIIRVHEYRTRVDCLTIFLCDSYLSRETPSGNTCAVRCTYARTYTFFVTILPSLPPLPPSIRSVHLERVATFLNINQRTTTNRKAK